MTEQEIFDRIVTIIQERQGEDFAVTETLKFKGRSRCGLSRLDGICLDPLEDEFGIEISDEEIDNFQSIADVLMSLK